MRTSISGKRVLVTGAGGWLGGEVAARLAAGGAVVSGLLRRPGAVRGNDGVMVPGVRVVAGDVSLPRLGWDAGAWRAEAGRHDLVVHCAASTRFDAAPEVAHAVNAVGTGEVAALAGAGGAGLVHVSTAYVNGVRDGVVPEDGPVPDDGPGRFNNEYERSKAAGEAAVWASGVPAVVARPSIILGDRAEGRVRTFGTFYYLLKVLAEGRVRRMPAEAWATLDMVPIDFVAAGLVALAGGFERAAGRTVHLVSGDPVPMGAFAATLGGQGLAVPAFVAPGAFEGVAGGMPGRAFERLIGPYLPYFARDPRFDDRVFRAVTGMGCPALGAEWWGRLVGFAVGAGFVDGDQASRTGRKGRAREAATPSSAPSR